MKQTQPLIEKSIYLIRDQRVLLDEDLARLYQVRTKALVQAVKRNLARFPDDFMFQLTIEEYSALRSQIVTLSGKAGRRALPYAFTEHGVAMLSSVLNSDRAVEVNIAIVRTFIKMRQMIHGNKELSEKLSQMERKYDAQFKVVFNSIRELIEKKPKLLVEPPKKHKCGHHSCAVLPFPFLSSWRSLDQTFDLMEQAFGEIAQLGTSRCPEH